MVRQVGQVGQALELPTGPLEEPAQVQGIGARGEAPDVSEQLLREGTPPSPAADRVPGSTHGGQEADVQHGHCPDPGPSRADSEDFLRKCPGQGSRLGLRTVSALRLWAGCDPHTRKATEEQGPVWLIPVLVRMDVNGENTCITEAPEGADTQGPARLLRGGRNIL